MLSIRTQDRMALVPYNDVISMVTYYGSNRKADLKFKGGFLGTYATKERAIEVLDEIEEAFQSQTKTFINEDEIVINTTHFNIVYQMPKE